METAVFIKYENGYYTFLFKNGDNMVFEEAHPRVLKYFDLKHDKSLLNQKFKLSFTEVFDDDDEDFLIFRIENLQQL